MHVDPTQTLPIDAPRLDELEYFRVLCDRRLGEVVQQAENPVATHEVSARELSDHEGMTQDVPSI